KASLAFGHAKPEASGAAASDTLSAPRANAAKSSTSVGRNPYSAKYCCIVSRRPALSATIATRASVVARKRFSATSGSSARRSTWTGGSGAVGPSLLRVNSMRANGLSAPFHSSVGKNTLVGGGQGSALAPQHHLS